MLWGGQVRPVIGLCLALVVLVSACGNGGDQPTAASTTTTEALLPEAQNEPQQDETRSELPPADVETLRDLTFAYWDAFNAYEADTVLSYLEEAYRFQREEEIRADIGRLSLFRVKLGIDEESPPTSIGTEEAEMFLTLREPLGTRRIRMAFIREEAEWKITFAEEVDD